MDAVEEIKQRLSIEEVVGDYVQLKRAGRNWKGLSPFGNERTPSFMVSPEKQIWHDFSTGKGGNMFSFVMEMEGLDFKGALELLARKAGVDLDQYRTSRGNGSSGKEKERLYEALEWACKFYQMHLTKSQEAIEYVFKKRAMNKETVLEWRLGYSPNNGNALVTFLKSKKFTDNEIKKAGLSAQRYRGVGDMFRGRIMVPLCDPQGRVIGFTARLLADDPNAPKYINTPQTPLYDKSRHVFGLHLAKEAIRKCKYVVVAEGNLDVISSHQAGVRQVVATAGTALTEQHLKGLSRFTGDIRLSFDADNAGLNATERAIPIASKVNVSLSIVTIPSGKDPDELVRQNPQTWKDVIEKPQYALDWLIARYQKQLDLSTAQGKRQFSDIVLSVIRGLQDKVEQEHYIAEVGNVLGMSRDVVGQKFEQTAAQSANVITPRKKPSVRPQLAPKATRDHQKIQNHLLCLALMQPKLRSLLQRLPDEIFAGNEPAQTLAAFLLEHPDFAGGPTPEPKLQGVADYVKILGLQFEELYQDVEMQELEYEAVRLQHKLVEQYVKMQKQQLIHDLQNADETTETELLTKVKELDNLLKTYKRGS